MPSAKPVGYYVDTLSIEPENLLVGERNLVIGCVSASVGVIAIGAMKFGAWWPEFGAGGIALLVGSTALIHRAWKADPWLSKVYARFRLYPSFIAAHASIASSSTLRDVYANRKHLNR